MGIVGTLTTIVVLETVTLVLASLEFKSGYSYMYIAILEIGCTRMAYIYH